MEKLTTTMKDAIKNRISKIIEIAKDYKTIIDNDYQFDDASGECSFYGKFHQALLSEISGLEKIFSDEIYRKHLELGSDFIEWADFYFHDNSNKIIDRAEAKRNFESTLSKKHSEVKMRDFIRKIKIWCEIRGHEYNPEYVMKLRSEFERKHNVIYWDDLDMLDYPVTCYGFYIGGKEEDTNQ